LAQDDIAQSSTAARGAMLVPVIAGSDKTTVSVATGHQEYHPVYASIGNISNTARRAHGNGVIPVAFLPIPKSKYPFVLPVHILLMIYLTLWPIVSKQTPAKEAGFSKILPPALPYMSRGHLFPAQVIYEHSEGRQMP
jgi:hypothetical protein